MLRGLLAIGVGILAWSRPDVVWASLVVFGVYAIVDGVFAIVAAIQGETRDRAIHVLESILGSNRDTNLLLPRSSGNGDCARNWPLGRCHWSSRDRSAVRLRRDRNKWLLGLSGIVSIIMGAMLFRARNLVG